jgi:hypothetical protein
MGMAASQARLLTITARMHDVEYQAQSIQNAKIALSTQEDQVHKKYLEALDATTMTVKDWQGNIITANFNTLCGISAADVGNYRYSLFNSKGALIVDDEIISGYNSYKSCATEASAEGFAFYMLTGSTPSDYDTEKGGLEDEFLETVEKHRASYNKGIAKENIDEALKELLHAAKEYDDSFSQEDEYEKEKFMSFVEDFQDGKYDDIDPKLYDKIKDKIDIYNNLIQEADYNMFRADAEKIFDEAGYKADFNQSDFEYYMNMYKQIQANGEYMVAISDFNGIDGIGHAATDSDWLQSMVQSGKITIDRASIDSKGHLSFAKTAVSSDAKLEYTPTSTIDKTALAKAEAEYEHDMKKLNSKDKKFDMDLSKLEAERTALKTEYESVKKVVSDNIERTFGIFS